MRVERGWWILRCLAIRITLCVVVMNSMTLTWDTSIVKYSCWNGTNCLSLSFRCFLFGTSLLTECFLHLSFFEFFRSSFNINKPFLTCSWVDLLYLNWIEFCCIVTDSMIELLRWIVTVYIVMINFWAWIKRSQLRWATNTLVMVLFSRFCRLTCHIF